MRSNFSFCSTCDWNQSLEESRSNFFFWSSKVLVISLTTQRRTAALCRQWLELHKQVSGESKHEDSKTLVWKNELYMIYKHNFSICSHLQWFQIYVWAWTVEMAALCPFSRNLVFPWSVWSSMLAGRGNESANQRSSLPDWQKQSKPDRRSTAHIRTQNNQEEIWTHELSGTGKKQQLSHTWRLKTSSFWSSDLSWC